MTMAPGRGLVRLTTRSSSLVERGLLVAGIVLLPALATALEWQSNGVMVSGENSQPAGYDPGPVAGVSQQYEDRWGFGGSVFAVLGVKDSLAARVGLRFRRLQYEESTSIDLGITILEPPPSDITLDLLELPATLILSAGDGPVRPYLLAEGIMGLRLGAHYRDQSGDEADIGAYSGVTLGLGGGAGLQLGGPEGVSFVVEGVYQRGLLSLFEEHRGHLSGWRSRSA